MKATIFVFICFALVLAVQSQTSSGLNPLLLRSIASRGQGGSSDIWTLHAMNGAFGDRVRDMAYCQWLNLPTFYCLTGAISL